MALHRYPTLEELGEYAEPFMSMCGFYLTAQILFGDRRWFAILESQCMLEATDMDRIVDVQQFIELFWMALHGLNWGLATELARHSWSWVR